MSRWRARSASRRASPSACLHPRRVLLPRVARGLPRREGDGPRAAGCRSIRRSTSFPPTRTHLRLARGGLDKQAAILPLIGRLKMTCSTSSSRRTRRRCSSARQPADLGAAARSRFRSAQSAAAGAVPRDDRHPRSRQALRHVHRGRRRQPRRHAGRDPRLPRPERRRQDDDAADDRRAAEADRRAASSSTATTSRREPEAAKASLGFIPDRPFIYEKLTAGEFLRFHGGLYGLDGDGIGDARPRDARAVRARHAGSTSWSRASRTA